MDVCAHCLPRIPSRAYFSATLRAIKRFWFFFPVPHLHLHQFTTNLCWRRNSLSPCRNQIFFYFSYLKVIIVSCFSHFPSKLISTNNFSSSSWPGFTALLCVPSSCWNVVLIMEFLISHHLMRPAFRALIRPHANSWGFSGTRPRKEKKPPEFYFFFFFRKTSAAADAREREFCWICAKLLLLVWSWISSWIFFMELELPHAQLSMRIFTPRLNCQQWIIVLGSDSRRIIHGNVGWESPGISSTSSSSGDLLVTIKLPNPSGKMWQEFDGILGMLISLAGLGMSPVICTFLEWVTPTPCPWMNPREKRSKIPVKMFGVVKDRGVDQTWGLGRRRLSLNPGICASLSHQDPVWVPSGKSLSPSR